MARRQRRLTRNDFERGLYGYHDPIAGIGGAPARSAPSLRLVLAAFGLLFCTGAAWFAFAAGLNVLGYIYILALPAVISIWRGWPTAANPARQLLHPAAEAQFA